ncbi:hypothetical protein, partial [Alistipes putredinis]|uniref:hypothetical protein n=1 Tax=Alistipes putredinis TaxID=28117 RepID=UPI003AB12D29
MSYPSPAGFRTCRRRSIVWSFIRRFPASGEARKRASPSPRTGNVCHRRDYRFGKVERETIGKLYGSTLNLSAS